MFVDSTVITIAHRLHTVIDYDKILVLNKGNIEEFDSPSNLLQNVNGTFYRMVQEMGEKTALKLHELAKKSQSKRNKQ